MPRLQVKPSSEDATHTWHTPTYCISCCLWRGRAGHRLDYGAWVGVEEWVGRYAPCFRARGVQRIRCCNRIRKLACERASRWNTALPSWNRLRLPLPLLLFRYWATVGSTESRCVYCSTVIARNFLLIAVVQVSGWYWDHVSVCEAAEEVRQCLFDRLTGAFTCVLTEPLQNPESCHVESKMT